MHTVEALNKHVRIQSISEIVITKKPASLLRYGMDAESVVFETCRTLMGSWDWHHINSVIFKEAFSLQTRLSVSEVKRNGEVM